MLYTNIRRLTPEIIKRSSVTFDVVWANETNMFIQLNPIKPSDIWKGIPDYDKDANPYLIPSNKINKYKILHAYR